jgi:hypothetical protein
VRVKHLKYFMDRVNYTSTGCWEWQGAKKPTGYGNVRNDGRTKMPHRVVFELVYGPIEESFEVDHLCRNRACCNFGHLEKVIRTENISRADMRKDYSSRTHCNKGHPFSGKNLSLRSDGGRRCKICDRDRKRNAS